MSIKYQKLAVRLGQLLSQRNNGEKTATNMYFTYCAEPAQPLEKDPKWTTAEDAVSCIKSGLKALSLKFINLLC